MCRPANSDHTAESQTVPTSLTAMGSAKASDGHYLPHLLDADMIMSIPLQIGCNSASATVSEVYCHSLILSTALDMDSAIHHALDVTFTSSGQSLITAASAQERVQLPTDILPLRNIQADKNQTLFNQAAELSAIPGFRFALSDAPCSMHTMGNARRNFLPNLISQQPQLCQHLGMCQSLSQMCDVFLCLNVAA